MSKLVKEVEDFELHHKILSFVGIIVFTIIITRLLVMIKDPNPAIVGYELHHFYYGIILLILTSIFMLFARKHYRIYLTLAAISIGLILDEFLYVMGGFGNTDIYNSTFLSAVIFSMVIGLIVIITYSISNKKKK